MANYAELDSNNKVIAIWHVDNAHQDMGPPEVLDSGARWLYDWLFHHEQSDKRLRGTTPSVNHGRTWDGTWLKQFSHNANFRHVAATVGDSFYDAATDRFLPTSPIPHADPTGAANPRGGWVWNYSTDPIQLEPPVDYPDDGKTYYWDAFNQAWTEDDGSSLGEKRTSKNSWAGWGPDPG